MQNIELGKPYDEYIQMLLDSGYYTSASEVLRDALRMKMNASERWRAQELNRLVEEGLDDVRNGKVVEFTEDVLDQAYERALENVKLGKPIASHIKP